MKRDTNRASKQVTAVFNALRQFGAASGERIARATRLSVATVGQVLWTLLECGIVSYSRGCALWTLEDGWFYGDYGMSAGAAVEVVTVLHAMRALAVATLDQLVKSTGLCQVGAGWSCEQLRKAGRLEYASAFAGWKMVA
jgi:DNA-binding IclR family transcriptional regulator